MTNQLQFLEAEKFGRETLANGGLEELRQWFSLSHTRLANHLSTNTTALRAWLSDAEVASRIQSTTAARIGQFSYSLAGTAERLLKGGVRVTDLYPLWKLAGELGRSPSSPVFRQMCQAQKLTCIDTGILGVYVPSTEAQQLKDGVKA